MRRARTVVIDGEKFKAKLDAWRKEHNVKERAFCNSIGRGSGFYTTCATENAISVEDLAKIRTNTGLDFRDCVVRYTEPKRTYAACGYFPRVTPCAVSQTTPPESVEAEFEKACRKYAEAGEFGKIKELLGALTETARRISTDAIGAYIVGK